MTEDTSHLEYEPNDEWVNYGDVNPFDHGGTFVKWVGDMWKVVETTPPDAIPECDKHLFQVYHFEPADLFVDGDPENGPTDAFESIIDALSNVSGFDNAMVDFDLEYFVADMMHYTGQQDRGTWVDDTEEAYWSELEEHGIDPDDH